MYCIIKYPADSRMPNDWDNLNTDSKLRRGPFVRRVSRQPWRGSPLVWCGVVWCGWGHRFLPSLARQLLVLTHFRVGLDFAQSVRSQRIVISSDPLHQKAHTTPRVWITFVTPPLALRTGPKQSRETSRAAATYLTTPARSDYWLALPIINDSFRRLLILQRCLADKLHCLLHWVHGRGSQLVNSLLFNPSFQSILTKRTNVGQ